MPRFPVGAPKPKVIQALERLRFRVLREEEHIAMIRENADGSKTPLATPNHPGIKDESAATSA